MRAVARDVGNCPSCFKPKDSYRYKLCETCRDYYREYDRKRKEKKGE